MDEIILLKLGELVLKGLNRHGFEEKLMGNAQKRLRLFGDFRVYTRQSTTYIEPRNAECDMEGAFDAMSKLFGVAGLTRAAACEKNADAMLELCCTYLGDKLRSAKSFKVESKRADKKFPMNSIQLSQYVGGELHERFPHLIVDVHNPELTVYLEVREEHAYVHASPEQGAGGLPVGMGGRAISLLSGGIDSPVSSWMMGRRGLAIDMVHFWSYPYTSVEAKEKVLDLAKILAPWCGGHTVHVVPFTHIQEEIRKHCPEELFTVIMRRFMMRIAEDVAVYTRSSALITGENLGQVASQTIEAMAVTEAVTSLPILRPLIGMDKTEIIRYSRRIGAYETSILPFEDCCTVFTPKRPRIKPTMQEVLEAEAKLDVDALTREAIDGIERIKIKLEDIM